VREPNTKKADVAEHPEEFRHVGLLVNESPGDGRVTLYLVVRQLGSRRHPTSLLHALQQANDACASPRIAKTLFGKRESNHLTSQIFYASQVGKWLVYRHSMGLC
jgi:hypothetical protein